MPHQSAAREPKTTDAKSEAAIEATKKPRTTRWNVRIFCGLTPELSGGEAVRLE